MTSRSEISRNSRGHKDVHVSVQRMAHWPGPDANGGLRDADALQRRLSADYLALAPSAEYLALEQGPNPLMPPPRLVVPDRTRLHGSLLRLQTASAYQGSRVIGQGMGAGAEGSGLEGRPSFPQLLDWKPSKPVYYG
eukprot:CAMPEP_0184296602 /NCGR_PEP_ID=MMETSP1049-20130417/7571_1 /TAXON_ID=77928 /ORGANISM="Proteomonas sulcata, Strain CCMP704" /LENGTH=136 /DNA_ID=CAMNT_0026605925 /DNA_START=226 /DNA_END=636 /DNA_ORIENTATION=+